MFVKKYRCDFCGEYIDFPRTIKSSSLGFNYRGKVISIPKLIHLCPSCYERMKEFVISNFKK